jgi:2-oxoglutarate ferredoxin oxidoreductase subunit beta
MSENLKDSQIAGYFPTWCPGCGNFGIWASIKNAFKNLKLNAEDLAVVFGIGCSGNMNDFIWVNSIHGLHGRAIPNAVGIKIANHNLPVVVIAGDGDCYGEGGNHFIHACRGNHDITVIVHDNRVYGLTTGQVAPTANKGYKSKSTPTGIIEVELNPTALAITQGASYVAQGFSGDISHLTTLIEDAIKHKGFSLVNVFQPCITFNKQTTYPWYRERVYKLDDKYNNQDKSLAIQKSFEVLDKIPIGVLYKEERPVYTDSISQLKNETLVNKKLDVDITKFTSDFI